MRNRLLFAAIAASLVACSGDSGTIAISIVTAPGSTVMDTVQTARLTLSDPVTVVETERDASGRLVLDLTVEASGNNAAVRFEGFDSDGVLVAVGATPVLPLAAIDADIDIYVAAPNSLAEAPVSLDPPRTDMGVAQLSYGVLFAGGRDGDGAASDDAQVYNTYDHAFQIGDPLPEPRVSPILAGGANGQVYIFGGTDDAGGASSKVWRFDTNAAPAGAYYPLTSKPEYARASGEAAIVGTDLFVVTGDPVLSIDGVGGGVDPYPPADGLSFDGACVSTILFSGHLLSLVAGLDVGTSGSMLISDGIITELAASPAEMAREGHACVVLYDGSFLVVGGEHPTSGLLASAVRFDAVKKEFTVVPSLLATPRRNAAIASSGAYVIVAGGTDDTGTIVGTAEIYDGDNLQRVDTVTMLVPRTGAVATSLPNGQIMIAGGVDENGDPVGTIELFTPAP